MPWKISAASFGSPFTSAEICQCVQPFCWHVGSSRLRMEDWCCEWLLTGWGGYMMFNDVQWFRYMDMTWYHDMQQHSLAEWLDNTKRELVCGLGGRKLCLILGCSMFPRWIVFILLSRWKVLGHIGLWYIYIHIYIYVCKDDCCCVILLKCSGSSFPSCRLGRLPSKCYNDRSSTTIFAESALREWPKLDECLVLSTRFRNLYIYIHIYIYIYREREVLYK